jgi:hypothetical protein
MIFFADTGNGSEVRFGIFVLNFPIRMQIPGEQIPAVADGKIT